MSNFLELGYSELLEYGDSEEGSIASTLGSSSTNLLGNIGTDQVSPNFLTSGSLIKPLVMQEKTWIVGGATAYDSGTGFYFGWDETLDNYVFFLGNSAGNKMTWDGTTLSITGALTATTGTIGGFSIGSDYIRDAGNSFGLASTVTGGDDVRFWAGAAYASRATAPFRITEAGAITATTATITGAITTGIGSVVDGQYLSAGTVASAAANIALRGWNQTCAFSVTDADTVSWGAGTFTASDGTSYSIGASNTGNMAAKTYIYLDIAVSTTDYQVTTTATTAVGNGKVLIAIAQNGTGEATFMVANNNSYNIDAANIVAGSITANEIAASTITAGKMSVSQLSAIAADLGAITAGTIVLPSAGFIRSGQTAYDTGTGFYIGNDSGTPKFSLGNSAGSKLTWDGTTLAITGSITSTTGTIGGFTIGATTITATNLTLDSAGQRISLGSSNDIIILDADDATYRIWVGNATAASAPFSVSKTGALVASSATVTGAITTSTGSSLDGQYLTAASVSSASANLALRGWTQTCAFSVTDADTIAWGAGTFTASDGTSYSIGASNTGNMAAKTYIYLDIALSTTAYQTTTTATTAIGNGKVLVAIAQNGTGEASFMLLNNNSYNIDAANIVAGSITANEIAASTITANKMSVSQLSAIAADLGSITAGTIVLPSGGYIRSGQTAYDTGTGFYLGNDSGTPKFSIGNSAGNKVTWDGTTLAVTGALTTSAGSVLDGQYLSAASVASAAVNLAMRGWVQTSVFSVTDADTVAWGAGTFTASDGTAYSINSGNTGNMAAKTYIYLDIGVSTTAYQTTTTAATATGNGKVLIAIAQNATGEATFMLMNDSSYNIDAANIVAGSITANEIAASTITAAKMSVSQLSAIAADLGAITAGTIVLPSGGYIRSGQTAYDTGTGFYLGNDSGTPKFSIGNSAGNKLTWNGTTLSLTGTITASAGTIGGFTIGATDLTAASGGNTTTVSSGSTAFSAGPTGSPTVTITQAGVLTATGATISGPLAATTTFTAAQAIEQGNAVSVDASTGQIYRTRMSAITTANSSSQADDIGSPTSSFYKYRILNISPTVKLRIEVTDNAGGAGTYGRATRITTTASGSSTTVATYANISGTGCTDIDAVELSSTTAAVAYSDAGTTYVVILSGLDSGITVNTALNAATSTTCALEKVSATELILITYVSATEVRSTKITISGTTCSTSTTSTILSTATTREIDAIRRFGTTNTYVVFYSTSVTDFKAIAGTYSSGTFTMGSEITIESYAAGCVTPQSIDDTRVITNYIRKLGGSAQKVRVISVSGTTLTSNTAYLPGTSSGDQSHLAKLGKFTYVHSDENDIQLLEVVGTTITQLGSTYNTGLTSNIENTGTVYHSPTRILLTYHYNGGSYGAKYAQTLETTNNITQWVGVAPAAIAAAASGQVITHGISDDVSGLTTGNIYYADIDGAYTTSAVGSRVGIASSSTNLIVRS